MLITSWVWCSLSPLSPRVLIRESRAQNNSQETMGPTSGLPDSASEGFWNKAAGRPASRSPELEPSALPAPELWSQGWGRDLLQTKNVSLIPGEGFSLEWVPPVPVPLGRGGEGALGSCKALLSEFYQRWPESLGFLLLFLLPSVTWGHRFSQNALHCEHLSAGGGHPTSEQGPGGVSITAFFKNKPGAAVDVGLTVCMCRDKCLWKWCP